VRERNAIGYCFADEPQNCHRLPAAPSAPAKQLFTLIEPICLLSLIFDRAKFADEPIFIPYGLRFGLGKAIQQFSLTVK
jgi:hypothetical protein